MSPAIAAPFETFYDMLRSKLSNSIPQFCFNLGNIIKFPSLLCHLSFSNRRNSTKSGKEGGCGMTFCL